MRRTLSWKISFVGLLFALALTLSFLEGLVSPVMGLPPGVKLGLSNTVVMFCVFSVNLPCAAALVVSKAVFSLLLRGFFAGMMSFAGGIVSLSVTAALVYVGKGRVSDGFISIAGAVSHNAGQVLAARALLGSGAVFYYAPVLALAGIAVGVVTGIAYRALSPYLARINPLNRRK